MRNYAKYIAAESKIAEYLEYDGSAVRWKRRPKHTHVVVGEIAGTRDSEGYLVVGFGNVRLCAHIIAWWFIYGQWPDHEVDHRNVDHADNRASNLRKASRSQNLQNRRPYKKTGLGLKGAYTHPSFNGRWVSMIGVDGDQIYLGSYGTEEEARAAYVNAAKIYHGEFARTE